MTSRRPGAISSLLPAALTTLGAWVVLVAATAVFLAASNRSVDSLITAGDLFVRSNELSAPIQVDPGPGYDGQFFYRLALDPFPTTQVDRGVVLDTPPYRAQRLMYPLLAWTFGGWHPASAPLALLLVNLTAWSLTAGIGVHVARLWSRPAWQGLLVALYPGLVLSTARDLSEVVTMMWLTLALALLVRPRVNGLADRPTSRRRGIAAGIALTLAILSRESAMVVVAGVLAAWAMEIWRRRPPSVSIWSWSIPLSAFITWQTILYLVWRRLPLLSGARNIGWPLQGAADFTASGQMSLPSHLLQLFLACLVAAMAAVSLKQIIVGGGDQLIVWCMLFAAGLWFSLTNAVWSELWAFMRAGTEIWCIGSIGLLSSAIRPTYDRDGRLGRRLMAEPIVPMMLLAVIGTSATVRWVLS